MGGGFGFVSKKTEFLWPHIPSFGQSRDAEPGSSLSRAQGEGGDSWGHFSGLATSTPGCHSTLHLHGGFKTLIQTLPQIRNGPEEAGKSAPLAQSLGCSVLVLPLDPPSSVPSCRTGAVSQHTEPFLHIFHLFKLSLAQQLPPSKVPGLLCPHSSQAQPWEVSLSWPRAVTAPRGDQRWSMVTPQDPTPEAAQPSQLRAQVGAELRSWELSWNPQRELTQLLAEEERCAGRV